MAAPGFDVFSKLIMSIPGSPLISLTVLTSTMSAITCLVYTSHPAGETGCVVVRRRPYQQK
ncbi:hypothetical protein BGU59_19490 [Clostridioides difficile]|nr:hypothetical protein BGU59_19490 [Clostridioides difficile]